MESIENFSDFKLSNPTITALNEMGFKKPTKIQLKAIPVCIKEKDAVVQAKTGSGKTLAFLIPIIELLHNSKCDSSFGIQAIILTPTAELASQTINVLSELIKYHPKITYLSVIGGKAHTGKKTEWEKIDSANILVSTLGRLLEHQEKNSNLDLSNLKYLVIDETDFLLETNFSEEMDAILEYLPKTRVTWLFSATQLTDMTELSRLSMTNPVFIGTESKQIVFPKNLTQTFMKVELDGKLQALWNILEAQHNSNVMVFLSTQKQVLFMYRLFVELRPSYKVFQLRSNMRLDKRIDNVTAFLHCKKGCVLFATDVAGRGLDFPNVSLVIQYDLPKKFDDYVHRAGRTARSQAKGVSVLMVMPSEMQFMTLLKDQDIILKQIRGNVLKSQRQAISEKVAMKYSSNLELFRIAKDAFLAYLRDYAKIPPRFRSFPNSKDIFVVNKLPVKKFARSFGFRSIPEETSELGLNLAEFPHISADNRPFFVVKKKLDKRPNRSRLDVVSDDDSSPDMEEEMVVEPMEYEDNIRPSFIFEEVYKELQASKQDKSYFNSVIRPKYDRKKTKVVESE